MKQNLLFLTAATALSLLASCSSDNIVSEASPQADAAIKFNTSLGNMTRGTTLYETSNFNEFKVVAFKAGVSEQYFSETVTKSEETWGMTTEHKWPSDGSDVTFFAYAPTSVNPSVNSTGATLSVSPDASPENHIDILTAYNKRGYNASNPNAAVNMKFKHALAKIIVYAKNETTAANNYKVEVKGVKIRHINTTGTLSFQTTSDGAPSWTGHSTIGSYLLGGSGGTDYTVNLDNSAKSIMNENAFLVIPQTVQKWNQQSGDTDEGAAISIYCKITQGSSDTKIFPTASSSVEYAWLAVPFNRETTWDAGKSYIYTIRFFADGTGGAGQGDPDDPNSGTGSVIQEVNIGFTTEIGDWEAGNSTGESIPSES